MEGLARLTGPRAAEGRSVRDPDRSRPPIPSSHPTPAPYQWFLRPRPAIRTSPWKPAGGVIRVDEPTGWRAYFCTDPSASVADILTAVADRFPGGRAGGPLGLAA